MPDEVKGKKPEQEGGSGTEAEGAAEVGGRGRKVLFTCWNCGRGNWIPSYWSWFTCWGCSALNYT